MPKYYILSSAEITAPGDYSYFNITAAEAKTWLQEVTWISAVGYPGIAEALKRISGIEIPVSCKRITMKAGDEALVFRLTKPLAIPENKGKAGIEEILENCEFGILRKES